ncbi:hypothetical protein [Roseomonas chloroacetimidivorans]|uniref:hypothetical protein n=1 Tax=Roseomonas chloroacetimidivorans TaxID=1766656 RepID=UPI003C7237CE
MPSETQVNLCCILRVEEVFDPLSEPPKRVLLVCQTKDGTELVNLSPKQAAELGVSSAARERRLVPIPRQ